MARRSLTWPALLLALPLALAACSSSEAASPAASAPEAAAASAAPVAEVSFSDLLALTFTSTGVLEDGADRPLAGEAPVKLTFTEDSLSANAGCNTLVGTASISEGTLVIDGALASTMMACEEPLMEQDTWLGGFLASSPAIAYDGQQLTLTSPTTAMTFALLETVGQYDTPIHGPEALAAVQAMCEQLVADKAELQQARLTAEAEGFVLRVTKEDGEFMPATMDLNPGRLNLEVEDGIVTGCTAG